MQFPPFFAFMDFGKLIDTSKLARSLKAEINEGLGSPKHKLLSYSKYTLLREEMCSVIYLFDVTGRKACQDSLAVLARGQVLFPHTKSNWSQGHKNNPGLSLPFAEKTFPREKIAEMNQKLIFGIRLHSSSSQAKNLNAPIKPSVHASTEVKGSAGGAQRDCILGTPKRHSSWQLPALRHGGACPRALPRQDSPYHH